MYDDLEEDVEALLDGTLARDRLEYMKQRAARDTEYGKELDAAIDAEWALRRVLSADDEETHGSKPLPRMSARAKEEVLRAFRGLGDGPAPAHDEPGAGLISDGKQLLLDNHGRRIRFSEIRLEALTREVAFDYAKTHWPDLAPDLAASFSIAYGSTDEQAATQELPAAAFTGLPQATGPSFPQAVRAIRTVLLGFLSCCESVTDPEEARALLEQAAAAVQAPELTDVLPAVKKVMGLR